MVVVSWIVENTSWELFAPFQMGSDNSKFGKTGEEWKAEIYFDPESDKSSGPDHRITDAELRQRLKELIDVDEEIQNISVYKEDLWDWQVSRLMAYHTFVLLETDSWWWSIEKNDEGITIQRSKKWEYVAKQYRRKERRNSDLMEQDTGRYKMMDLVDWIYKKDELNKRYHFLESNCQGFAKRIFDEFAKNKFLQLWLSKNLEMNLAVFPSMDVRSESFQVGTVEKWNEYTNPHEQFQVSSFSSHQTRSTPNRTQFPAHGLKETHKSARLLRHPRLNPLSRPPENCGK